MLKGFSWRRFSVWFKSWKAKLTITAFQTQRQEDHFLLMYVFTSATQLVSLLLLLQDSDDEKNFLHSITQRRPRWHAPENIENDRLSNDLAHIVMFAKKRNACFIHLTRRDVHTYCKYCQVYLCSKGCFSIFHSVRNYKKYLVKHNFT